MLCILQQSSGIHFFFETEVTAYIYLPPSTTFPPVFLLLAHMLLPFLSPLHLVFFAGMSSLAKYPHLFLCPSRFELMKGADVLINVRSDDAFSSVQLLISPSPSFSYVAFELFTGFWVALMDDLLLIRALIGLTVVEEGLLQKLRVVRVEGGIKCTYIKVQQV